MNLRLPTRGGLYAWEFQKDGRQLHVRVDGQLTFNCPPIMRRAAIQGLGLAFVLEDQVQAEIADGRLSRVLADWRQPFAGYPLYYPTAASTPPLLLY